MDYSLNSRFLRLKQSYIKYIETFYYRLGIKIANNPWKTILAVCIWSLLSLFGLLSFHYEQNPVNLWIPKHSKFYHDTDWLINKFKQAPRPQHALITAPNILEPYVIQQLFLISEKVKNIKTDNNITWNDVCIKVPNINSTHHRRKRQFDDSFDPSSLPSFIYCNIIKSFPIHCLNMNLIDIFKTKNLTKQDIINEINKGKINKILEYPYEQLLSGIERNSTGHIISAKSVLTIWPLKLDFESVDMDSFGNFAGTADWASDEILDWEKSFLEIMKNYSQSAKDYQLYYEAGRSFGDISDDVLFQDANKVAIGVILMIIYTIVVISKFNCIEFRIVLGGVGLLCIGLAFICSCALCSVLKIPYGPVHTSLPFLLMGLGVDDMFIMIACWEQLPKNTKKSPLSERVGLMLQHAGVSITVTSITDVAAFLVGSLTIIPSLRSFCLYAASGVTVTFIFSVTFFTACFVLDQKRIEAFRNSFLIWHGQKPYVFSECSQKSYAQIVVRYFYSKILLTIPGKVITILLTLTFCSASIKFITELEQKFDENWFIPESSYYYNYLNTRNLYYPSLGYTAGVYTGNLNYSQELMKIHNMSLELQNLPDTVNNVKTWTTPFIKYIRKQGLDENNLSYDSWRKYISKFLFSPNGAHFQANFRFEEELKCGELAPNITISSIEFRFNIYEKTADSLSAMHKVREITEKVNFTSGDRFVTVWGKMFGNWETNEIFATEITRNLILALICVMTCTVLFITNVHVCFWIFICVSLTVLNVCGWMHVMGLTINMVAGVGLQLSVGLCVDYAAHIGHTFLTISSESRNTRVIDTMTHIGGAVLYGGGSTLLALSVLGFSEAYVFQSFFKIFLLVILFGLFHGVIFLPVVLSLIGPKPYKHWLTSNVPNITEYRVAANEELQEQT